MTPEEKKKLEEQQQNATNVNNDNVNDNDNVVSGEGLAVSENNVNDNQETITNAAPITQEREPVQLRNWYETLFRQDNAGEAEQISEEQRRKMARRERAERIIAGLGDICTHIANIAYAGKGATPAQPKTTMSENVDNAWKYYNQDIEKRRAAYRQGLNAARQMDYRQYMDDRRQQLAYDREERLRIQQAAMADYRQDMLELRQAEWELKKAQLEQKNPLEIQMLQEKIEGIKAQAAYNRARAEGRTTSVKGGKTKTTSGEPTKSELLDEFYALGGKLPKGSNGLPVNPTADQIKGGIRALRKQQNLPPAEWDKPKKDYTAGNGDSGKKKNPMD